MALTPIIAGEGLDALPARTQTGQTSETYRIDWRKRRIMGRVDGVEAMEQAIYKILQTERFDYRIYSWNYGIEFKRLFGHSRPVVEAEARRVITEALLADDRILQVKDFNLSFPAGKRDARVVLTAVTSMGDIPVSTEVRLHV